MGTADGVEQEAERRRRADALTRAAAAGDRASAAEFFADNLGRLGAIAQRIAGTSFDPGDLLGETIASVLTRWRDGKGPSENVVPYMAQAMRNRIKDERKSPRSQVAYFDDANEPMAEEDPRIREIDVASELAVVSGALATLPDDQQLVLTATVIEGAKPRDLEERLGRTAKSIHSLSWRARLNLRRAVLRAMLEKDAPPECAVAARRLPETVGDSPEQTEGKRLSDHYRTCRRCRRVWGRFAALATLGLVPLLVVGDLVAGSAGSAQAVAGGQASDGQDSSDQDADSSNSSSAPSAAAATVAPPTAGAAPTAAAPPASAPSIAPPAPVSVSASAPPPMTSPAAAPSATAPPAPGGPLAATGRVVYSGIGVLGRLAIGAGIVIIGVLAFAFVTQSGWFTPTPNARFDATSDGSSATTTVLTLDFEVFEESWKVQTLTIELTEDVTTVRPPAGWTCDASGKVATCTTDLTDADGGVFEIDHAPSERVRYSAIIAALAEGGATVDGHAVGTAGD